MKKILTILLIVAFLVAGCAKATETPTNTTPAEPPASPSTPTEPPPPPKPPAPRPPAPRPLLPEGHNWYYDDEFGYMISYPEDWTVVPKEDIAPLGEGTESAQFFREPDTPSTILVSILSEFDIERFKDTGAKAIVINGREGYEVIMQPIPLAKERMVVFFVNDKYYLITCSTSVDLFDKYAATFDNAINSFVIE